LARKIGISPSNLSKNNKGPYKTSPSLIPSSSHPSEERWSRHPTDQHHTSLVIGHNVA
jgi:hypothetical protein